jgi:hypothetical protein
VASPKLDTVIAEANTTKLEYMYHFDFSAGSSMKFVIECALSTQLEWNIYKIHCKLA